LYLKQVTAHFASVSSQEMSIKLGILKLLYDEYTALELLLYLFWNFNKHQFICNFNVYEKEV